PPRSTNGRLPCSPPGSRTKICAKVCKKRSDSALPARRQTAQSDTLFAARKTCVLQGFLVMAKSPSKASYSAKDITVLEGLEPVRLRPGMYIGSTGSRGLHHLVYEVVDNAVDEAMGGHNDSVEVTIHPDNSVTVRDRGRGIPVDVMPENGLPATTVV